MDIERMVRKTIPAEGSFDLDTSMVVTLVGASEVAFNVHESVVRSHQGFFSAALSKNWKEGNEKLIRLPEDRPDYVKIYIQWLYGRKILLKWTTADDEIEESKSLPEVYTLTYLYLFGEKYCDVAFKNAVITAFIWRTDEKLKDACWYPSGKMVDIIYNETAASSPLRRLAVDTHIRYGHAKWFVEPIEDRNKEFLLDLIRTTYTDVKETGKTFKDLDADWNPANYREGQAQDSDA